MRLEEAPWSGDPIGSEQPGSLIWNLDREYVHVPAAAGGYIDEYIAQYDYQSSLQGTLGFILQDANFNVVALADGQGRPVAQYSYYPYGAVKALDIFDSSSGAPAPIRMGHQGLFFDRFDVPWANQRLVAAAINGNSGWLDGSVSAMSGRGVYQNRARSYDPGLGRFITRDPNATGQTVPTVAYSGLVANPTIYAFDVTAMYSDGMNLHAYLGSNPLISTDPLGLLDFNLSSLMGNSFIQSTLRVLNTPTVGSAAWSGVTNLVSYTAGTVLAGEAPTLRGAAGALVGGAIQGALTGGLGPMAAEKAGGLLSYGLFAAAGGIGNAVSGVIAGDEWNELFLDFAVGAVGGAVGHAVGQNVDNIFGAKMPKVGPLTGENAAHLVSASVMGTVGMAYANAWLEIYRRM